MEKKESKLFSTANIRAAIVFCCTSVPIAGWTVYEHWMENKKSEITDSKRFEVSLQAIDSVYDALRDIVYRTGAYRALLLRAEDSGDIPVPGKDIYSSIVYEVFDSTTSAQKPNWRRQLIDAQYTSMLTKVAQTGHLINVTAQMPEGILKNVYVSKGVKQTHVFAIHQEPAFFFYCSIVFRKDSPPTVHDLDAMRSGINKIRTLFQENRKNLQVFKRRK